MVGGVLKKSMDDILRRAINLSNLKSTKSDDYTGLIRTIVEETFRNDERLINMQMPKKCY